MKRIFGRFFVGSLVCLVVGAFVPGAARAGITQFPLPTPFSTPLAITAGPDGALWFSEIGTNSIGRLTIDGTLTEFPFQPYIGEAMQDVNGITAGPDGALWFTESTNNRIGRVTTDGTFRQFLIRHPDQDPDDPYIRNAQPMGITTGPDGAIWFGETSGNRIGRLDSTTGKLTEFLFPPAGGPRQPHAITAGPDGALWFTVDNAIGRITTSFGYSEFPMPTRSSAPLGITAGPDGALWFTDDADKIGRITTTGTLSEFSIPTYNSFPRTITSGSDGALWFTELNGNKIGRITTSGRISEFDLPVGSYPQAITSGSDGALWFTGSNRIWRITTDTRPSRTVCGYGKGKRHAHGHGYKKHADCTGRVVKG